MISTHKLLSRQLLSELNKTVRSKTEELTQLQKKLDYKLNKHPLFKTKLDKRDVQTLRSRISQLEEELEHEHKRRVQLAKLAQ